MSSTPASVLVIRPFMRCLTLCAIVLLAIASTATAKPTPLTLGLASNGPQRRSSPYTKGTITCVDIHENGRGYNVSLRKERYGRFQGSESGKNLLNVIIDLDAAKEGPVNIEIDSGAWFFKTYFGAISLDDHSASSGISIAETQWTEAGAPPTVIDGIGFLGSPPGAAWDIFVESAIWRYDPMSGRLTPQWINFDHSTPPLLAFYDSRADTFGITEGPLPASPLLHECHFIFNKLPTS